MWRIYKVGPKMVLNVITNDFTGAPREFESYRQAVTYAKLSDFRDYRISKST